MKIIYKKRFDKSFQKIGLRLQNKIIETIQKFQKNPLDPILKNHELKGSMTGKRAISVTGDVRIIFEEYDNYMLVIMLDVGTHNQVY